MPDIVVVDPDPGWPAEFDELAVELASTVGGHALRIDHIGSTSVPDLPAKDVIDVQITTTELPPVVTALTADGFEHRPGLADSLTGCDNPDQLVKAVFTERAGQRRANIHVRISGRLNQRYALLFRDYLRAEPAGRDAYGDLKLHLATLYPDDVAGYYAIKEPVMDIIYRGAEAWAEATGWSP